SVVLLSCFLSGLFAFYLARELGLGRASSVLVGVVFALSPPRFYRLGQLHLATVQWIPLCLALLHRYARGGSRRHLVGATLAFTLQALSGGQSALFLALTVAALLAYLWMFGELRPRGSLVHDCVIALFLGAALNLPFVLPYLEVQRELGLARSLDEAEFWSPNAASYLASPTHVHRWLASVLGLGSRLEREAKAYLFPGFLPVALSLWAFFSTGSAPRTSSSRGPRTSPWVRLLDFAIIAVLLAALLIEASGGVRFHLSGMTLSASGGVRAFFCALALLVLRLALFGRTPFAFTAALRSAKGAMRCFLEPRFGIAGGFYLALAIFSFWASLGPGAGLYGAMYRLVPGFDFIRVPSRFFLLSVLALAVLAGIGAERLRR
ncbi:MAG: hypothetical protein ACRD21_28315, partial [Vicinamibacteria bacterium]